MTDMPPYLAVNDEEKDSGQDDSESSSDVDDWDLPLCFNEPRHIEPIKGAERIEHSWRVKEKYKTHCVALVLCLNVGVDPPDVVKTQPCARLECWIDPNSLSPSKALESIGHALQSQYERWQPRARYKQSLDPTSDEVKKLCCSLRRNAKDERVLFHYNGHGVPKPTVQGEIWVFNRAYTQYIPLSMYDLQTWMGAPSLYVYDCSNAGVIVDNFRQFAEQHEREYEAAAAAASAKGEEGGGGGAGGGAAGVSYRNCIQLGACAAGQSLPMNPELPADLFTACLTTPVKMAMKWFVLRSRTRVAQQDLVDLIDKIPGQVTDRRTMLGELNWIFTAITDTIAWSSLPPDLFQQLFRADLLTASLCRNFLLADRIMRSYNCTPVCTPPLPSLARHALWAAWEHTLDLALAQLPALAANTANTPAEYRHSRFFRDQLTAFGVWLARGAPRRPPPAQLPMVLQVLLSTLHRVRALQLLCRYLALGAPAVRHVLHVGIFPYMLKLLQASAADLRASMVYIWAKIIAVDPSCQVDLVNAKGHKYFLSVLQDPTVDVEHRRLAAYVLAGIVDNYPPGQEAALQASMVSICLEQLSEGSCESAGGCALQQWVCIALGRAWRGFEAARWAGARDLAHEKLFPLLCAPRADTRAACAFALGAFMAAPRARARSDHANALDQQVAVALARRAPLDASALVRQELLAALQWPVLIFEQHFIAVYLHGRSRHADREPGVDPGQDALAAPRGTAPSPARPLPAAHHPAVTLPSIGFGSVYMKLWETLSALSREPHPLVAQMASDVINYIANQVDSVGREVEVGTRIVSSGGERGVERGGAGSASLPPSPNTRASPLHHDHTRTLPAMGSRRSAAEDGARRDRTRDRDSTSSTSSQPAKKPIVSTQFVEWAWAREARAEGEAGGAERDGDGDGDCESRATHERAWRRARNRSLVRGARALRGARARLEAQAFQARCALPAGALQLHPYEQHVAVAARDALHVWDWGAGARLHALPLPPRLTSVAYLNAHERPLLAAASHAGDLHVYRLCGAGAPRLAAAWRALNVRPQPAYRPPPAQPLYSLAQLVSEQFAAGEGHGKLHEHNGGGGGGAGGGAVGGGGGGAPATLVRWAGARGALAVGGGAPHLRVWDARTELLARELPTQTAADVTALAWPAGALRLVAGFSDGALRAWDERAPDAAACALQLHDHQAPLLCAAVRHDTHTLLTAWSRGGVRARVRRAVARRHRRLPRGRAARRRRRAPARRPARLRVGEPVHQHLRPEGHAAEHHKVPRGVHGRAHRARLLPRLPPAQVRAGRGREGLDGVGVRVGRAPVTLARRPPAHAAVTRRGRPVTAPHTARYPPTTLANKLQKGTVQYAPLTTKLRTDISAIAGELATFVNKQSHTSSRRGMM